jgi:hypothetical protein
MQLVSDVVSTIAGFALGCVVIWILAMPVWYVIHFILHGEERGRGDE